MGKVIAERWEKIQKLPLLHGSHRPDSEYCVMEAAAFVAGEDWTDHPKCVPPTIAAFFRIWNDQLPTNADRDCLLKHFIPRIIGLPMDIETETKRAVLAGDWLLRVAIPEILRLSESEDCKKTADRLASLPEAKTLKEIEAAALDARAARAALDALAALDARAALAALAALAARAALDALAALDARAALAALAARAARAAKNLEESQSALAERMIETT